MKKLIFFALILIFPFIICSIGMEVMLRKIPSEYMVKSNFLNSNAPNIKILVLGSSHGITAIDPECFSKQAYNAAHFAQTLDIDYMVLDKYQDKLDSLEYLVLPVSYHLLWTKLDLHNQKWRNKYYNIYYDVNQEPNPLKRLMILDQPISKDMEIIKEYYFDKQSKSLDLSPLGLAIAPSQTSPNWINSTIDGVVRAHSTSDLSFLYDENVSYLKKIIDIVKKKNAKVIFVTIPAYESFITRLHPEQLQLLYSTMENLADDKDVYYFNCLNDFIDEGEIGSLKNFRDADHLSLYGAHVFSSKLDSIIQVIEKNIH